ncbi:MAG: diacylglycerol kinase family protein [Patescibacteria group bacterium]
MSFLRFHRLLKSFKYAISGFLYALKEEQNFRIHILATIIVVILMFALEVSKYEAFVLIISISLVLIGELVNSVFERIVDILKPRLHPYAEKVKDMMAAIVLIASLSSIILGLWIFVPKILALFK